MLERSHPPHLFARHSRLSDGAIDIVAGTVAGMASKCIAMPFDTVKVRMQTATSPPFASAADCFRHLIRNDGVSALYRGIAAPLCASMLANSITFLAYGEAQRFLRAQSAYEAPLSIANTALAGGFAGVAVSFCTTPVEMVKRRLQMANSNFSGVLDCVRQTYRTDGMRGFYRGHSSSVLREAPGNACYFAVYEFACRALSHDDQPRAELSPARLMLAGSISGMAYWSAFFPADVVQSRMQTDAASASGYRRGFASTMRHIYRAQGWRGLYSGFGITLLRAVPANACVFYCYESTVRLLGAQLK